MFNKLIGVILVIAAISLEISWLAFCFGSVVVGLLLLIFAPGILLLPFNVLFAMGMVFLNQDAEKSTAGNSYERQTYDNYRSYGNRNDENSEIFEYDYENLDRYYEVLGCNSDDDFESVQKAYRELSRKFHPDTVEGKGLSEEFVAFATQKMQEINEAYEKIKNERSSYAA